MPKKLSPILAFLVLSTFDLAPASGQESYSYEEQEACTSDAFRLCSDKIPDIPKITACMQAKRDQLSPKCARMFVNGRERHPNDPGQKPYHDSDQPMLEEHRDHTMQ